MTTTKKRPARRAGQVGTYDFQADTFGGQYTLIERAGPNCWLVVDLPPSEAEIAAIREDPWYAAHGGADEAIARRWERWGQPYQLRFVSRAAYDRHF